MSDIISLSNFVIDVNSLNTFVSEIISLNTFVGDIRFCQCLCLPVARFLTARFVSDRPIINLST